MHDGQGGARQGRAGAEDIKDRWNVDEAFVSSGVAEASGGLVLQGKTR